MALSLARFPLAAGVLLSLLITQPTQSAETWLSKAELRHKRHHGHHKAGHNAHHKKNLRKPADADLEKEMEAMDDKDFFPGGDAKALPQKTSTKQDDADMDMDEDEAVKAKLAQADKAENEDKEDSQKNADDQWEAKFLQGKDDEEGSRRKSKKASKKKQHVPSREECEASQGEAEGCGGKTDGGVAKASEEDGDGDSKHAGGAKKGDEADEDSDDAPPPPKKKHRRHGKKKQPKADEDTPDDDESDPPKKMSDTDFMQQVANMDPDVDPESLEAQKEGVTFADDLPPASPFDDDGGVEGDAPPRAKPAHAHRATRVDSDESAENDDTDDGPTDDDEPARGRRSAAKHVAKAAATDDDDDSAPEETKREVPRAHIAKARHHKDVYHMNDEESQDSNDRDEDVDAEEAHESLKHGGLSKEELEDIKNESGMESGEESGMESGEEE